MPGRVEFYTRVRRSGDSKDGRCWRATATTSIGLPSRSPRMSKPGNSRHVKPAEPEDPLTRAWAFLSPNS